MDLTAARRPFRDGPVLETERLILRPPAAEDFDAWAEFAADPASTEFLGGAQPRALAWRQFAAMAGAWALYGFGMFSLLEKGTGRWLGRIGPWRPDGWPGNEVGWGVARAAEGRGYAFEAAQAAMDWAFDALGWDTVIHCIDPANRRSEALARRLGARLQGRAVLPLPIGVEVNVFGQTRAEWRARAGQRGRPR